MVFGSNIYLIGYRCTGKTSIGKLLAERLSRRFIDTDVMVADQCRMPISEYVDRYGWQAFRDLERTAIESASLMDDLIVATGGGAVLAEINRNAMKESGRLIWLKASPEVIRKRLAGDNSTPALRPPLSGEDVSNEVEHILTERTPIYRSTADFEVDTDHAAPETVCDRILDLLGM